MLAVPQAPALLLPNIRAQVSSTCNQIRTNDPPASRVFERISACAVVTKSARCGKREPGQVPAKIASPPRRMPESCQLDGALVDPALQYARISCPHGTGTLGGRTSWRRLGYNSSKVLSPEAMLTFARHTPKLLSLVSTGFAEAILGHLPMPS